MILGYPEETLRSANGLATAREIRQQPATWRETLTMVEECRATIERFLLPLLSRGNLRVILTGAGTSAFAGRALAPISVPASTAVSRRSPPPTSSPIRANTWHKTARPCSSPSPAPATARRAWRRWSWPASC